MPRWTRRLLWTIGGLLAVLVVAFVLRGWIFRHLVAYRVVASRPAFRVGDSTLAATLADLPIDRRSVSGIVGASLDLTSRSLRFEMRPNPIDPNRLVHTHAAHCVGYAEFFATACNRLLRREGLDKDWIARPVVGKLTLWGIDIHPWLPQPFFRDHDFAVLENRRDGERFAVDPTVADYLWIDSVSLR